MTKALFKKQMMELLSVFVRDRKSRKKRFKRSAIMYTILYIWICGVLGWMFFSLAEMLCAPLVAIGQGWLYFSIMAMMAIAFGVFGSVFNTFSSMYQAKDNDLLLSMPIPTSKILFVRLLGVYVMGLFYEALIIVPAIIVYIMESTPGALSIIFSIILIFVISILILVLSCILGWLVALISSRVKNKSIITVVLALTFLVAYFYFYSRAYKMLQSFLANIQQVGDAVKRNLYPIYHMGKAAEGNVLSMLIFTAIVLVAFGIVYVVLAHSFIKIATTNRGAAKYVYKEKAYKKRSADGALVYKEAKRFLGSPTYMLNCGLGTVMLLFLAGAAVIKGDVVRELIVQFEILLPEIKGLIPLIICACISMVASMNDITAPSVSLEGKTLWILQSMPVSAWQVLKAKLKFHMIVTAVPALISVVCLEYVVGGDVFSAVLIPVFVILFILLTAAIGLAVNLKMPNLNWTNETVAVKQSIGVLIAIFSGWVIILGLGGLYVALLGYISAKVYLICATVLVGVLAMLLIMWIKTRGAKIFESL